MVTKQLTMRMDLHDDEFDLDDGFNVVCASDDDGSEHNFDEDSDIMMMIMIVMMRVIHLRMIS